MSDEDKKTNNEPGDEDHDLDTGLSDDELWGGRKPQYYEPDYSDVRKKIFSPVKMIVFILISAVFWAIFYFVFG